MHLGFAIRIDPRHWRNVNPFFWETGTYKFAMQVSASNADKPGKLTLFVDWDDKNLRLPGGRDAVSADTPPTARSCG